MSILKVWYLFLRLVSRRQNGKKKRKRETCPFWNTRKQIFDSVISEISIYNAYSFRKKYKQSDNMSLALSQRIIIIKIPYSHTKTHDITIFRTNIFLATCLVIFVVGSNIQIHTRYVSVDKNLICIKLLINETSWFNWILFIRQNTLISW